MTTMNDHSASLRSRQDDPANRSKNHRRMGRRRVDTRSKMKFAHHPILTFLLLTLIVVVLQPNTVITAYLNGANPNNPKLSSTKKQSPTSPSENERYTFLTKPRDRYFTATGVLPPLLPASYSAPMEDQDEAIPVTYTNDPKTVDEWLCRNVPYDGCFLGFDIERLPESRSEHLQTADKQAFAHAAVVQLATTKACLVVHLVDSSTCDPQQQRHNHPKHSNDCARILRTVLEDPSIIKAGCSIDEDLVLLHELWDKQIHNHHHHGGSRQKAANTRNKHGNQRTRKWYHPKKAHTKGRHHHQVPSLQARSRFDLGCVVMPRHNPVSNTISTRNDTLGFSRNDDHQYKIVAKRTTTIPNKSGLRGLCEFVLGVDLPKEKDTCASDWTIFPLRDDQITYAARDAWAGATIATKLASMDVASNTPANDENKSGSVFFRPNLIRVLRKSETPLPQLAQRHRQRKEAKSELHTLLHPYARNLFLNQQNERRHQELQKQQREALRSNSTTMVPHGRNYSNYGNTTIDVSALFADYPLITRKTLANYAQKQQQLMEKSLPKRIRKRSIVLRQAVNAKVIDHKVVFEVDLVHPQKSENRVWKTERKSSRARRDWRNRKRRNPHDRNDSCGKRKR